MKLLKSFGMTFVYIAVVVLLIAFIGVMCTVLKNYTAYAIGIGLFCWLWYVVHNTL